MANTHKLAPGVHKILEELRAGLEKLYGDELEQIILYGSYARGDARPPDSDLDVIAVITDYEDRWEELKRTSQLVSGLSLKHEVSVSLLLVRHAEWEKGEELLYTNAREEGIAA